MITATETLVTFLVDSVTSAHSIQLLGSWDNFTTPYSMLKDKQKGQGHWYGSYSFKNIICDGDPGQDVKARDGGLLMGGTYWYYYKLNGDWEFHNPSQPSTTYCPLLPGQTVNVLEIPNELPDSVEDRNCTSLTEVFTLKPDDRFVKPVPPKNPRVLKNSRSHESLRAANAFFKNARTSRSPALTRPFTAPAKRLLNVEPNDTFGVRSIFGRPIYTSPAESDLKPCDPLPEKTWGNRFTEAKVATARSHSGTHLMRAGTLKFGRPSSNSSFVNFFSFQRQFSSNSLPKLPHSLGDNDYFDFTNDDRPFTYAGEAEIYSEDFFDADVDFEPRRVKTAPNQAQMYEFSHYVPPLDGQGEVLHDDPEELPQKPDRDPPEPPAVLPPELPPTPQGNFSGFKFGFTKTDEETESGHASLPPSPIQVDQFHRGPRPLQANYLYTLENITAERVNSRSHVDAEESTPRPSQSDYRTRTPIWASTTTSTAEGCQSPTFSCPTESIDSPTSLRCVEHYGSDRSGAASSAETRPSTVSLPRLSLSLSETFHFDFDEPSDGADLAKVAAPALQPALPLSGARDWEYAAAARQDVAGEMGSLAKVIS